MKFQIAFISEQLFPLCKDMESLSFLFALLVRMDGYQGPLTEKYLGDKYDAGERSCYRCRYNSDDEDY